VQRREPDRGRSARDPENAAIVANGWTLYTWPAFAERWTALREAVEEQRKRDPDGYRQGAAAKLFLTLRNIVLHEIPSDPAHARYRQGLTLGDEGRHWRRAKFHQRFRLFFRYHSQARIIVYAWLNDELTLRKAGSRTDPYHVFGEMLRRGRPPSDWNDLVAESNAFRESEAPREDA
jgi:toxin YhaV